MKRSKALKTILKICKEWESSKPNKEIAEEILQKLEDLGMSPPIKFYKGLTYRDWDENLEWLNDEV